MRLTKYAHACILVEDAGARILIDPGVYSPGFETLTDLTAILITHQHADHADLERLPTLLERNPGAPLYSDEGTAAVLREHGIDAEVVRDGDRFDAGTDIAVHGVNHAIIHRDIPIIPNVGYLVGGRILHPGDSYTEPAEPVDVLCLPTGAPWLKAGEAVDYLRAVAPRLAVPIHEAVLSMPQMHYGLFDRLSLDGTTVRVVEQGETFDVTA